MVGKTFGRLTVVEQVPGAGRCDGAGSLVPLHLPVRGGSPPGHQPAPGDHPELQLSSPGGDPDQEPGPGSPAPRPHRAALPPAWWWRGLPQRQRWAAGCGCAGGLRPKQHQAPQGAALRRVKSCGCLPTRVPDDLTGQRFGRLTVLALMEARGSNGGAVWQCQCDCGAQCQVPAGNLRQGALSLRLRAGEDLTGQRAAAGRGWHSLAVPVPVRSGEIDPPGRHGGGQNPELRLHHLPRQRENRPDAYPRGHFL